LTLLRADFDLSYSTSAKESRMREIVATELLPDLDLEEVREIDAAGEGKHSRHFVR
jgi:hypothetical protein